MHPGQGDRQFDLAQGRRGRVPAPGAAGAALRRRRRRHGVRREGAGGHVRAQDADLPPLLRPAGGQGRLPARGPDLRPERVRDRHRHRRAQQLRRRFHQRDALDQGTPAAREGVRWHLERQLQLPRQRRRARGDPHGVPVPRHPRRPVDGHRQRGPAGRLRRDRAAPARTGRGRGSQSARARRREPNRASRGLCRNGEGERQGDHRGSRVARDQRRGAPDARAGQGHHVAHHRGHGRGTPQIRAAHPGDRGTADGGNERCRRPVRRRQDVPAAGRQVGARDEAGGGPSHPVHRRGEGACRRCRQAQGHDRHGDGQGRRPRHRQEHRRRRSPVQQLRRHRPGRDGPGAEDPGYRAGTQRRHHRAVGPHHAFARGNGARGARDAAPWASSRC